MWAYWKTCADGKRRWSFIERFGSEIGANALNFRPAYKDDEMLNLGASMELRATLAVKD